MSSSTSLIELILFFIQTQDVIIRIRSISRWKQEGFSSAGVNKIRVVRFGFCFLNITTTVTISHRPMSSSNRMTYSCISTKILHSPLLQCYFESKYIWSAFRCEKLQIWNWYGRSEMSCWIQTQECHQALYSDLQWSWQRWSIQPGSKPPYWTAMAYFGRVANDPTSHRIP